LQSWSLLQDQKRYLRLICVHRRHLRPCLRVCICGFRSASITGAVAGRILAGSKPVNAPRRRAKPGAFARSKNAICVSSVFIGVICVPVLSAYICDPPYLRASAASDPRPSPEQLQAGSWRAASR
jgi:hypothetical protein